MDLSEKMKDEMDRAWKDYFEKNPSKEESAILRQVEERMKEGSMGESLSHG